MNYYEHHLGDYDGATAHLSWLEDCAYRRMIGLYYRSGAPLPADIKQVCRLVRAVSKQEREAVEQVLREFFTLTDDGYRQHRCDADIARFKDKQRKAKASANARWSKSDGNADAYANASGEDMRTHTKRNANGMHRAPVPSPQTPDNYVEANASTPLVAAKSPRPARKAPAGFTLSPELAEWCAKNAPGVDPSAELAKLKDHTFATARVDWPGTFRNWMRKAAEDRGTKRGHHANGSDIFEGTI